MAPWVNAHRAFCCPGASLFLFFYRFYFCRKRLMVGCLRRSLYDLKSRGPRAVRVRFPPSAITYGSLWKVAGPHSGPGTPLPTSRLPVLPSVVRQRNTAKPIVEGQTAHAVGISHQIGTFDEMNDLVEKLNALGRERWEAVSMTAEQEGEDGSETGYTVLLKRERVQA